MIDVKKIVLNKKDTILKALELLDLYALRIVLVVDEDNHLLGSITDGDIRRGLLKGQDLHASVETIMHLTPYSIEEGELTNRQIFEIMREKRYLALPVLKAGQLVNIITLEDLISRKRKENPVFIMAGGFGTRLRPLTDKCPKPMLPVGGKPLLETIVLSLKEQGFYKFYISTHYLPEIIHEHFGNGEKFDVQIQYVHENDPLGTGGALSLLPKEEIKLPFVVINGDVLTNMNFGKLLDFHEKNQSIATMCVREFQYQIPYGVVNSEDNVIQSMTEKPSYFFDINTGIYVISPELLAQVNAEFIGMPTILEQQITLQQKVTSYPLHEYWLDIGHMEDYNRAQKDIHMLGLE
ncbi:nucleotidyltransferase family protein [Acinetobacter tibetensis]|jgi:dTDP-glucose pyrophosphorylase|uniref:Nucleotidyltransferase family protein n=1 Tax=Acinetobacter tibetensis TaxID=2943497 RepID=A0AAE9S026_9GAMM|nr:nucleotidyltransferase family protein [Acinetobacter tibetensis]USE83211.1 nucleotidyltransferase family protein [Acinetobacter tibetensis]